jgi:hypothetical protein
MLTDLVKIPQQLRWMLQTKKTRGLKLKILKLKMKAALLMKKLHCEEAKESNLVPVMILF